jgi:hypothetical protein
MKTNRSLRRVTALTGAAAFLFSFAHVSPAAAQTTRHAQTCTANVETGATSAACTLYIPSGKRFVIETVSAGGVVPSTQRTRVEFWTWLDTRSLVYSVPAGFQVLDNVSSWWAGALTSTVFSEVMVRLKVYRSGSATAHDMRLTVAGYLEDM